MRLRVVGHSFRIRRRLSDTAEAGVTRRLSQKILMLCGKTLTAFIKNPILAIKIENSITFFTPNTEKHVEIRLQRGEVVPSFGGACVNAGDPKQRGSCTKFTTDSEMRQTNGATAGQLSRETRDSKWILVISIERSRRTGLCRLRHVTCRAKYAKLLVWVS